MYDLTGLDSLDWAALSLVLVSLGLVILAVAPSSGKGGGYRRMIPLVGGAVTLLVTLAAQPGRTFGAIIEAATGFPGVDRARVVHPYRRCGRVERNRMGPGGRRFPGSPHGKAGRDLLPPAQEIRGAYRPPEAVAPNQVVSGPGWFVAIEGIGPRSAVYAQYGPNTITLLAWE